MKSVDLSLPHLTNLNEDPLLTGKISYSLEDGIFLKNIYIRISSIAAYFFSLFARKFYRSYNFEQTFSLGNTKFTTFKKGSDNLIRLTAYA